MTLSDNGTGTGIAFSMATAIVWAISPLFMASVGRRIGSFSTNMLRVLLAILTLILIIFPTYWLMRGGQVPWPDRNQSLWLMASGTIGMVLGDACFYEALVLLGPRRAVKINTLAPVVAVLSGWMWLGEALPRQAVIGVAMVIGAIMYATFANPQSADSENREPGQVTTAGLICGFLSALCIGLGTVLGRHAFKIAAARPLDPIAATVVRVGCPAAICWGYVIARGRVRSTLAHLGDPLIRARIGWGTLLGPITGMLGYVTAMKFAPAGLVSTIIATSPLVILPVMAVRYGVPIRAGVVLALIAAVVGVGMISLTSP